MADVNMNVKILQVVKTTSEWADVSSVISRGLLCIELAPIPDTSPTEYMTLAKVGDGVKTYAQLDYLTPPVFEGATANADGHWGVVPTPLTTDRDKFLSSNGGWQSLPVGALYKVAAVNKDANSATDELGVYKSIDGGTTWTLIDETGSAAASGATKTVDLGLLDSNGKVKSEILPSYVDDIVDGYYYNKGFYADNSHTQLLTPEASKIYVDLSDNATYRWNGSTGASSDYIKISNPIDASVIYTLIGAPADGNFDASHHGLVPAPGSNTGDNLKILRGDGWASLTTKNSNSIAINTTTAHTTELELKSASTSNLGGVKIASTSAISNSSGSIDVKTASASQAGVIKVGTGLTITSGVLSTDGQANQNAFSNIKVGSSTVEADSTTDTFELVAGSNVTLTADTTNDKITIAATDTTYSEATTSSAGLMSSADKTKLDGIASGAEVNQNAFSNVKVGSSTVAADSKTDTLELAAGSNITLTPDTTNDKITIAATDTTYEFADSYNASTNKGATVATVTNAINALDVPSTGTGAITGFGNTKTLASLTETDGKIAATFQDIDFPVDDVKIGTTSIVSSGTATIAVDGTYNSSTNKIATKSTVTSAIAALDGSITGTPGTTKTLTAFSQTDGAVSATFSDIAFPVTDVTVGGTSALSSGVAVLGAAAGKGVTDNSTATAVTSTDTNLITGRTLYNAGYIKNISINGTSGKTFTGIAKSATINGGATIAADSSTGNIALTGIVTGLSYTNSSGSTATLTPTNGNLDVTSLILNCTL